MSNLRMSQLQQMCHGSMHSSLDIERERGQFLACGIDQYRPSLQSHICTCCRGLHCTEQKPIHYLGGERIEDHLLPILFISDVSQHHGIARPACCMLGSLKHSCKERIAHIGNG